MPGAECRCEARDGRRVVDFEFLAAVILFSKRKRFSKLAEEKIKTTEQTCRRSTGSGVVLVHPVPAGAAWQNRRASVDDPLNSESRLLAEFKNLFEGHIYRHRSSTQGDYVAMHLFEDLYAINRSAKLIETIAKHTSVLNVQNRARGIKARRGDGTFGEIIPGERPISDPGFVVARGPIAAVEIGVEVRILAKAMIKQIDRVTGDLLKQISHFKRRRGNPISVGIVGINHAKHTVSYEGERATPTTGHGGYQHPIQEAPEAERRLLAEAVPGFDEFIMLRYKATNEPPFAFEWVDYDGTRQDHGAALARISREYQKRF
jgi:hypothetical protein